MNHTGIRAQSAASILEDVDTFYFGGVLPWYHGTQMSQDGTRVIVTLDDPDEDEGVTKTYELSANQITAAFETTKRTGDQLCCLDDIESMQLGFGCAQDLDAILQTACYGKVLFA